MYHIGAINTRHGGILITPPPMPYPQLNGSSLPTLHTRSLNFFIHQDWPAGCHILRCKYFDIKMNSSKVNYWIITFSGQNLRNKEILRQRGYSHSNPIYHPRFLWKQPLQYDVTRYNLIPTGQLIPPRRGAEYRN